MASLVHRLLTPAVRPAMDNNPVAKDMAASQQGHHATQLMDLPPELHLLISEHLIYPDALSLRHVNRYFYGLVDTGIELKIDWLVERRRLHLECPNNTRCDLGSDLRFCRGSVRFVLSFPLNLFSRVDEDEIWDGA